MVLRLDRTPGWRKAAYEWLSDRPIFSFERINPPFLERDAVRLAKEPRTRLAVLKIFRGGTEQVVGASGPRRHGFLAGDNLDTLKMLTSDG